MCLDFRVKKWTNYFAKGFLRRRYDLYGRLLSVAKCLEAFTGEGDENRFAGEATPSPADGAGVDRTSVELARRTLGSDEDDAGDAAP